jgi:hypothetical protein
VKGTRQKKYPNDPSTLLEAVAKLTEQIRILDNSAWSMDNAALFFVQHWVSLKTGLKLG